MGGFVRQIFITTRTFLFFSAENVALPLPLEAGARYEQRLLAVACKPSFGADWGQPPAELSQTPRTFVKGAQ